MTKEDVIRELELRPLIGEGGFVNELYRGEAVNGRQIYGTIYYLLTPNCCSIMHRLDADEVWYYHDGPPLEMLLIYKDHYEVKYLGNDLLKGERPQILVPKGVYQGSHMAYEGDYSLVSTSMSPAYDPEHYEVGTYEELKDRTDRLDLLKLLTQEPRYE
ncbi:MAG: cupin domain-containing protein [Erysipelotrichaceae bacterium]|nr:cupin domain-containing protein [Erysipelotrichaceae bacterium]